jgi:hypothetical protein
MITQIQLYNILRTKLGDAEAHDLVSFIKAEIKTEFMERKDVFLTKEDKVEMMRAVYMMGLVQFFAIVGAVLAIIGFIDSR